MSDVFNNYMQAYRQLEQDVFYLPETAKAFVLGMFAVEGEMDIVDQQGNKWHYYQDTQDKSWCRAPHL